MNWYQEYKSSIKVIEIEEIFDLILYRPLAFLFVKAIYKTKLSPNNITLIGIIIGVIGGFHFSLNNPITNIVGAAFVFIYVILDCSDGMIARLKNNGTFFGRILDGIADYIVGIAIYLGIGFGFASTSDDPLFYWGLLLIAALSNIVQSISLDFYRTKYRDHFLDRDLTLGVNLQEFKDEFKKLDKCGLGLFSRVVIWIYLKYSAIQLKLYAKKEKKKLFGKDDYLKRNRKIVHLWTYIGPSSALTLIIISAVLSKFYLFMWVLVVFGNSYGLVLFIIQNQINKKTKKNTINNLIFVKHYIFSLL